MLYVACVRISSFLRLNSPLYVYTILFIQFICHAHLGCFYVLAIVNDAALNTGVQISVQVCALNSFEYIPRIAIAGS